MQSWPLNFICASFPMILTLSLCSFLVRLPAWQSLLGVVVVEGGKGEEPGVFGGEGWRVNTVKDKNVNVARPKVVVNTARPKAVVNAVKGNNVNAVKATACWVWKPKPKVLDHGNPQMNLQDKGVIDSGCSRHMTGNMSYLTDYEEIDGGYVAFRGNPKGGKITGKGTIKTGNLDFENVYFERELKFNLFGVTPRKFPVSILTHSGHLLLNFIRYV
ncbi:hypothetical protein Tco_1486401 [Tanacetum coccineum]